MRQIITELIHFRELLSHEVLFAAGMLLLLGYLLSRLAEKIHLPEITGFIITGILLGPSVLRIVDHHTSLYLTPVTDVALGVIAFTIGGEFARSKLKRMGKEVLIITIAQILGTFGAVSAGLILAGMEPRFAFLLGAIATATAPAATVAIVQSLRAQGKFIDRLFGLVALDDAGCIIIFGVTFALVTGTMGGGGDHGAMALFLHSIEEIVFSLIAGALLGYFLNLMTRNLRDSSSLLIVTVGFVFIGTSLADVLALSPLLTNMAMGTLLINLSPRNHRVFRSLEPLSAPIYALFFAIAGAELQLSVFAKPAILLLGFVFIITRALGKYFGVFLGSVLARSKKNVRQFMGFCMLPQAGVAIGLVILVDTNPVINGLPPAERAIIQTMVDIILLAVFVNELAGPPLSKYALVKALKEEN